MQRIRECNINQLYNYYIEINLFYESQYGFRKSHFIKFATLRLIDRALKEICERNENITTHMDLSKTNLLPLIKKILLQKVKFLKESNFNENIKYR